MNKRMQERRGKLSGFTLVELSVVCILLAVLATMALPRFTEAVQQSYVDSAGARLEVLWTAQRLYWLKYRVYAESLDDLLEEGLIDPALAADMGALDFDYVIALADEEDFLAEAAPAADTGWSGGLQIDKSGVVSGSIWASGRKELTPARR